MALTDCPECGMDVSDTADECPHCGYDLIAWYEYEGTGCGSGCGCSGPIIISFLVLMVISFVVAEFSNTPKNESKNSMVTCSGVKSFNSVKKLQKWLIKKGHEIKTDGIWGPNTNDAVSIQCSEELAKQLAQKFNDKPSDQEVINTDQHEPKESTTPSSESSENFDAIFQMTYAFDGDYSESSIKRRLDQILRQYEIPQSESNYRTLGNVAVKLRQESGVPEMDLLKCARNADMKNALYDRLDGDVTGMRAYREAMALCSINLESNY